MILGDPPDLTRLDDEVISLAIERLLERISEGVSRLHRASAPLQQLEPEIRWNAIRTFGNIARHEYDAIEPDLMVEVVVSGLAPLRAAALRLKARFEGGSSS